MKTPLAKICAVTAFLWLLPYCLSAQETINLYYNAQTNSIDLKKLPKKVEHGKSYSLVLKNINTAHTEPFTEVTQSRFVSDIPAVLSSMFPGIPDNAVGMNFSENRPPKRAIFIKATKYYEDLATIQRIADDLYLQTRFEPKLEVADTKKKELLQELGVTSLPEAYARALLARRYLESMEEVYSAHVINVDGNSPQSVEFLDEYATVKSYLQNISNIDFSYLLHFIEESQQAVSSLSVASFTVTGDVVDVALQLVDTYTGTTLVDETLSFATYNNFSFDFSTGFFYTNLIEPEYYLETKENGKLYIQEENKSQADISIGALGHFTYRFSPQLRSGVALGAAISPFDGKLRYLMGPTIIWGGEKQVSLTFGLALSQMNELSDAVLTDETGSYLPDDLEAVPTINKLQTGFFIGVSYNLTNRKQS